MFKHKDLQECYEITGINPLVLLEASLTLEDLKKLDPKLFQYMVWKYRKRENPDLKLNDVEEYDFEEVRTAIKYFFLKE